MDSVAIESARHSEAKLDNPASIAGTVILVTPIAVAGGAVFLAGAAIYNVLDPFYMAGNSVANRIANRGNNRASQLNNRINRLELPQEITSSLLKSLVGSFKRFNLTQSSSKKDHDRAERLLCELERSFEDGQTANLSKLILDLSEEADTVGYRLSIFRGISSSSFEKMILDLKKIIKACPTHSLSSAPVNN